MSIFGAFFMGLLGVLIKHNYMYIGEWFEPEVKGSGAPTEEQIESSSTNCFIVMAVYLGFLVLSLASICVLRAKSKRG